MRTCVVTTILLGAFFSLSGRKEFVAAEEKPVDDKAVRKVDVPPARRNVVEEKAAPLQAEQKQNPEKKEQGAKEAREAKPASLIQVFGALLYGGVDGGGEAPADPADAMKLQFVHQLRPILKAELRFVQALCKLPPEQAKQVEKVAEHQLQVVAKDMAAAQQQAMQVGFRPNQEPAVDPRARLQAALITELEKVADDEQYMRYRHELDSREKYQKEAIARLMVAKLDKVLVLTNEQRTSLKESFLQSWNAQWSASLTFWQSNEHYYPEMQEKLVNKALNPKQLAVWRGLQKINFAQFGGWAFMPGGILEVEEEGPVEIKVE